MFKIDTKSRRSLLICGLLTLALAFAGGVWADGDEGPGEGEEEGALVPANGIHSEVRNGVRLILGYSAEAEMFVGTMQNISEAPIADARVEVHVVGGSELGPTPRTEIAPGEAVIVTLPDEGQDIRFWRAHSETGSEEHGAGHGEGGEGGEVGESHEGREGGESHASREGGERHGSREGGERRGEHR